MKPDSNEAEHKLPAHMQKGNCYACGKPTGNPWERAGRHEKVSALVHAIDLELGDAVSGFMAGAVADQIEQWPCEAWIQLAQKAGVIGPSMETVAEVIRVYRLREKIVENSERPLVVVGRKI